MNSSKKIQKAVENKFSFKKTAEKLPKVTKNNKVSQTVQKALPTIKTFIEDGIVKTKNYVNIFYVYSINILRSHYII